ncbi:MFS general substrate transporter [Hysterangium stoloniferum]|nr:MFS general substrate transporter [Hysterangium stoloniferum]
MQPPHTASTLSRKAPLGLKWRSSPLFVTLVVGFGITTDIFSYAIIIPVIPFRLEYLGYTNSSELTGWLLFAYSAGLVLSTPPIAYLSERYNSRRMPLLLGLLTLIGSQILFMLAPYYWPLVLARVIQGVSSTVVWTVGLALVCDTVPASRAGQQLGLALSGLSIGFVLAPPIGGALYRQFGLHAPMLLCIGIASLDIVGRLVIIERKDALQWGIDPAATPASTRDTENGPKDAPVAEQKDTCDGRSSDIAQSHDTPTRVTATSTGSSSAFTAVQVLVTVVRSRRACAALSLALIFGVALSAQEPTLPLRLQDAYGLSSAQVGLVYLGASLPTLLSTAIAGWLSDRTGTGLITLLCAIMAIPWFVVMAIHGPLALMITGVVISTFFVSAVVAPLSVELAATTRDLPGVGYSYVYGAFNLAYGVGSLIGPIMGGQIYDHDTSIQAWIVVMALVISLMVLATIITIFFTGVVPFASRIMHRWRN